GARGGDAAGDGQLARVHDQPVALLQQLVQRPVGQVLFGEVGGELDRDVGAFDRQRLPVGGAQPLDEVDVLARLDAQLPGQVGAGAHGAPVEVARAGHHAPGTHVLGERGELEGQLDLGTGDEGALARHPVQAALGDQVVDRL